jgi:hypothetical protein
MAASRLRRHDRVTKLSQRLSNPGSSLILVCSWSERAAVHLYKIVSLSTTQHVTSSMCYHESPAPAVQPLAPAAQPAMQFCHNVHGLGCTACTSCHSCRQKTVCPKTSCGLCNSRRGSWCGRCLERKTGRPRMGRSAVSPGVGRAEPGIACKHLHINCTVPLSGKWFH